MDWNNNSWGWGSWVLMSLMMLAVLGVVIWLGFALANHRPKSDAAAPTGEHVLAQRFARGEIDEAEYQQRLRVLRGQPGGNRTDMDKSTTAG